MKANILLVDDEPQSLFAMEQLLAAPDRNVIAVESGKAALRQILKDDFALILLDVRMPEMDGFEVATLARQLKRSRYTPIIFLTAAADDAQAMFRGYEIGVVDFIMKPVDAAVLQSKAAVFVGLYKQNAELAKQIVQRRTAARELSRANEDLETKIRERTTSLIRANELLRREVAMRQLAEDNLRKSEMQARKLAMVASRTENAVIITDAEHRIEWVNESFTRIYGYTLEEARGRHAGMLLAGHADSDVDSAPVTQAVPSGDKTEVLRYRKDGSKRFLLVESQTIDDDMGTVTGFIEIETDITERKQAEEDLHKAKQAAEAANQAKSEFLANMSHEIRTPMNAIIGMTELALQTPLSAEQREYMTLVKASGEMLLTIINDILDFSKIEAGRLEVETIPFSLRECVGETLKTLAFDADRKGLGLTWEIADDLPDALLGDPVRLRQVIVNLVGNAIKFTESGEVVLQARLHRRDDRDIYCYFAVRDTGVGISKDKQATIFAPFFQADTSTTRLYGGTGLGLTISAHLVEIMNGEIWLDSEPGQGSVFHFTLRFSMQNPLPMETAAPQAAGQVARRTTGRRREDRADAAKHPQLDILLVEDNAVNRRLAQLVLEKQGHRVAPVDNGAAALDALTMRQFDMVLMDVQMPRMDGLETAAAIRARERETGGHIPIIALTAHAMARDRERCLAVGMDGYLMKPIHPASLLEAILRLSVAPSGDTRAVAGPRVLDRDALLEQVDGDIDLLNEIVGLFVRDCGKHMAAVREAMTGRDVERLGYVLHTLVGIFRNLCADAAHEVAAGMEELDPEHDCERMNLAYGSLDQEIQRLTAELLDMCREVTG